MKQEQNPRYICDPQKNKECSRNGCPGFCTHTMKKEFAKIDSDGNPIIEDYLSPPLSEKLLQRK